MKTFLVKYKWTIISWAMFLAIVLIFAPWQEHYYFANDIKIYKQTYLACILIWTGIVISVGVGIWVFIQESSAKASLAAFLPAVVFVTCFLFIFQHLFLDLSLFLNRQFKRDSLQRSRITVRLTYTLD